MKKTTKEAIQDHFEQHCLSDKQFDLLNKIQETARLEENRTLFNPGSSLWNRMRFTFAGAAVLFVGIGLGWFYQSGKMPTMEDPNQAIYTPKSAFVANAKRELPADSNLTLQQQIQKIAAIQQENNKNNPIHSQIAKELAYNHKKNLDLEFVSTNMNKARDFYQKLDFPFVQPKLLQERNLRLLGGRYSSVGQRLAAHMRMVDPESNHVYSLYQYRLSENDELQNMPETWQTRMDGVTVKMWVENGVLYGMAVKK